jgi:hypothetical protein
MMGCARSELGRAARDVEGVEMAQPIDLSPAGLQLGLGSMLADQVDDETERKRRLAQMAGRPLSSDLGYSGGSLITGPLGAFTGRLR